jgi:hypothetical protein
MPAKRKCKETLQQVKERLIREQRLRTEKRLRELLEPEQLAVTEDESNFDNSELEIVHTDKSKVTASSQKALIIWFILIAVLVYLSWFSSSYTCYYRI